ncbi:MAG: cytosolic protein [Pseudomonadota bacterium]
MDDARDDYDSPWKEILEDYFQEFMRFFFSYAADEIDWERGYQFLDKELEQIVRDAELGKRYADKLVQLWQIDGESAWVMVHVEVQGEKDADFAKRMYVYNYRIFDRYDRPVASLAVLADNRAGWRPESYTQKLFGCETGIRFPVVKLLDYMDRWEELQSDENPFAIAVMAHLKTRETQNDATRRKAWKVELTKSLYAKGYRRKDVLNLFRFIDWIMRLPDELETVFWEEIQQYEEDKQMPYVTSVEKIGIKKGMQQGMQQGMLKGIEQNLQETIHKMYRKGLTIGQIADILEMEARVVEHHLNSGD